MNIAPAVQFVNDNWQKVYTAPGSRQTIVRASNRSTELILRGIQELLDRSGKIVGSVVPYGSALGNGYSSKVIGDAIQRIRELSVVNRSELPYQPYVSDLDTQWGRLYLALLRDTPPAKAGGFTQADMDAAEKRGYDRCKADVARLRA